MEIIRCVSALVGTTAVEEWCRSKLAGKNVVKKQTEGTAPFSLDGSDRYTKKQLFFRPKKQGENIDI